MVPLWFDGALRKALRTDLRTRYDSFSEFFHDLSQPNDALIKIKSPLIDKNPVLFWKVTTGVLILTHIFWAVHYLN